MPFKAAIDDHIARAHEALLLALKRSVVEEATQLGDFVKQSLDALNAKPASVAEMGAAAKAWTRIAEAKTVRCDVLPLAPSIRVPNLSFGLVCAGHGASAHLGRAQKRAARQLWLQGCRAREFAAALGRAHAAPRLVRGALASIPVVYLAIFFSVV